MNLLSRIIQTLEYKLRTTEADLQRALRRNYENDELHRRRRNFFHAEAVCHGLWRMEKDVLKYGNPDMVAAFKRQVDAAREQCDIAEQQMLDFEGRNVS